VTEPPEHAPPTASGADPTRDIRLPPVAGSPPPVLPAAWARPLQEPDAQPASALTEPTERLEPPRRPRERTLAFSSPEMVHRPVAPVQVGRAPRRWPWVVLIALPLLIIVGTGIWLLLLLRAA